jgi:hypothetical protein
MLFSCCILHNLILEFDVLDSRREGDEASALGSVLVRRRLRRKVSIPVSSLRMGGSRPDR